MNIQYEELRTNKNYDKNSTLWNKKCKNKRPSVKAQCSFEYGMVYEGTEIGSYFYKNFYSFLEGLLLFIIFEFFVCK